MAITVNQAKEAIYQRFNTLWAGATPFTFDNENFSAPTSGSWVRLVVRDTGTNQETLGRIGNRKYNRQGSIIISIFTDIDSGISPSDALSQSVRDIFEGVSFSSIYTNDTEIRQIGPDGRWYQVNAETFFFYEELK